MRTQLQAIMLGAIGTFLASPVPKNVMAALSPGDEQGVDNVYATSTGKFWLIANDVFMPFVQVIGIVLVAWAAIALLSKGRSPAFRRPVAPMAINHGIAILLVVATVGLTFANPPSIRWPTDEVGDTLKRAGQGLTGSGAPVAQEMAPAPTQSNTTSAFGDAGTPANATSAFAK